VTFSMGKFAFVRWFGASTSLAFLAALRTD